MAAALRHCRSPALLRPKGNILGSAQLGLKSSMEERVGQGNISGTTPSIDQPIVSAVSRRGLNHTNKVTKGIIIAIGRHGSASGGKGGPPPHSCLPSPTIT